MPLLTLIIFVPLAITLVGAIVAPAKQMRLVALVSMIVGLALTLLAASQFDWSGKHVADVTLFGQQVSSTFQLRDAAVWLPEFKISYIVGADNLSMLMILLTSVLGVFGVLCSWNAIDKRQKEFYVYLLLLQAGILGTFLALDMFLFYMFWELMLIPLYFMIGIWGSSNRLYATMKFVLYTLVGSVLMLIAIIWMYFNNGYIATGATKIVSTYSYEMMLATQNTAGQIGTFHSAFWPFLALFLAFAIKVPLFPLHTWLPDAHTEAPTAGSVILAGVLLKTGGYGILRFCLPLFPEASVTFAPAITWLAVIAIIYGAWTAIVQTDIKRLIAYSSVSHMGFVIVGIFSMNSQAMAGAVLQMINHGISTSGLFLAIGMLYERAHTRDMAKFGGLAHTMPVYAALTLVMVLSSVGLPGLNGFLGEFSVLLGSMHHVPLLIEAQDPVSFSAYLNMQNYTWLVTALATTGIIFGAVYLLIMYQKTFFGKAAGASDDHGHGQDSHHGDDHGHSSVYPDLSIREWGQLAFLAIAALVIGLYPKPIWNAIAPATRDTLRPVAATLDKRIAELPNANVKLAALSSETRLVAKQ
ncbi:MAG: NADH-quinone oxidoreductase subunit M [Candidatus Sumerlaeota bacterium]